VPTAFTQLAVGAFPPVLEEGVSAANFLGLSEVDELSMSDGRCGMLSLSNTMGPCGARFSWYGESECMLSQTAQAKSSLSLTDDSGEPRPTIWDSDARSDDSPLDCCLRLSPTDR
jgi:hypothetical protein